MNRCACVREGRITDDALPYPRSIAPYGMDGYLADRDCPVCAGGGRVVTRRCGHVEAQDHRDGSTPEEAATKLCLACWATEHARQQAQEEREERILDAGKRAMAYMHARYGPVPRGDHPETGEPLADKWHEKLGLLIDFQTFDPDAPDFTPEDGKL
jgi:hypothetical protein